MSLAAKTEACVQVITLERVPEPETDEEPKDGCAHTGTVIPYSLGRAVYPHCLAAWDLPTGARP